MGDSLKKRFPTEKSLLEQINKVIGRSIGEFDVNKRFIDSPNDKGVYGHIVEEGIFGYSINSNPKADFDYLNLELKTTGLLGYKKKNGYRCKERLTLCSLNYEDVAKDSFSLSNVWNKNKGLFIVLYDYLKEACPHEKFPIIGSYIHRFTKQDERQFEEDYQKIKDLIIQGRAEDISESLTKYLAACTAGSSNKPIKKQPFSTVKVKARKFCIKESYITEITHRYLSNEKYEKIFKESKYENMSLTEAFVLKFKSYIGKNVNDLQKKFKISTNSKNKNDLLLRAMLGIKCNINKTEEVIKAGLEVKTVQVNEQGLIDEHMSFENIDFIEASREKWEDCAFRNKLLEKQLLLIVFKEEKGINYFKGIKFFNIPASDVDKYGKKMHDKLKKVLLSGKIVKNVTYKKDKSIYQVENNFPKPKDNKYFHVRPKGQNRDDTSELPFEECSNVNSPFKNRLEFTKQCYFINKEIILTAIMDLLDTNKS